MIVETGNVLGVLVMILATQANAEEKWIWSKERNKENSRRLESAEGTPKITIAQPILNEVNALLRDSKRNDGKIDRIYTESDEYDNRDGNKQSRYRVSEELDFESGRRPPIYQFKPKYPEIDEYASGSINTVKRQPGLPPPPPPGPPQSGIGILTGPVPSWEKPIIHKNGDPTSFQRCRCSFSFNCKSPGVHFGNCDQGKEYCCFNDVGLGGNSGLTGTLAPNIDRIDRQDGLPPILVGPGGPVDGIRQETAFKPIRPYDRIPPRDIPPPVRPYPAQSSYGIIDRIGSNYDAQQIEDLNRRPQLRPDYDRDYDRRPPLPLQSQKPVLPPYVGLHNDYRSS